MAMIARPFQFKDAVPYRPAPQTRPRRGFWRALYDAIVLAHQRDTQREIDRFVARRGKLTDSMEREIFERFTGL